MKPDNTLSRSVAAGETVNEKAPAPFSRQWLPLAVLALAGLVLVVGGSLDAQRRQNSAARTAMVVAEMQAGVQALGSEAIMAARGNPGAIDNFRVWRNRVGVSMTLLEKGGYAASTDPAPVLALEDRSGFPLADLRQSLLAFDNQTKTLEEAGAQLREAADAEVDLTESIRQIAAALAKIERSAALAQGPWATALGPAKGTLSRPEMRTMRVIFSPLPGAEALQTSWAKQFAQTAAQLSALGRQAEKDPGLSASDRALLGGLVTATQRLTKASGVLAQTQAVRLAAQQQQGPLQQAAVAIQKPLGQVGTKVLAMQKSRPWSLYVAWVGVALVLAGLVGLVRVTVVLSQEQWMSVQDTRSGQGASVQIDRLTRRLRRIVSKEGMAVGSNRLEEEPEASTFALASMVNQLLDNQAQFQSKLGGSADEMVVALSEAAAPNGRMTATAGRLQEHANRSSELARSVAQALAQQTSSATTSQQAQRVVEMTAAAELVMQEGTFKMDAMRETIQGTAKRLKRLAEGAQSIAVASSIINEISRRVKVLSTNAAIEAAAHGEGGRAFAVLAKETERLSQSAHEAAGDIGRVVQTIQVDAQETVAAMEASTTEVVASTELTGRANAALRDIERVASTLVRELETSLRDVEKQAVSVARLSQQCDETAALSRSILDDGLAVGASLEKARQVGRGLKKGSAPNSDA